MVAIPPAGVSPAGFFVPTDFAPEDEPVGILADAIDPDTGELMSILRGFDPTDAAAIHAMRVEEASGAAVEDTGHRFRTITHVGPRVEVAIAEEVRHALRRLTQTKQIRIERLEPLATPGQDYAEAIVVYKNLARDEQRKLPLSGTQLLGDP